MAAYCRNIAKPDGTAVPGIIIPFSTTIQHGKNFFGLPLAAGDHAFTPRNFATKIQQPPASSCRGYVGMDAYADGEPNAGAPAIECAERSQRHALCLSHSHAAPTTCSPRRWATPTPCARWTVQDQALPLPFNLGATAFNATQFFNANGTLSEQPWVIRKHQAFRAVDDPAFFYGGVPDGVHQRTASSAAASGTADGRSSFPPTRCSTTSRKASTASPPA